MRRRAGRSRSTWRIRTCAPRTSSGCGARSGSIGRSGSSTGRWLVGVRSRRLGLQLQRWPSGGGADPRAAAGDARARRRLARVRARADVPAGIVAALRRGRWFDRVTTIASMAGISMPAFWFGLLLQMIFAVGSAGCPRRAARRRAAAMSSITCSICCCRRRCSRIVLASGWSRYLRGSMIETLSQPFICRRERAGCRRSAWCCATRCGTRSARSSRW